MSLHEIAESVSRHPWLIAAPVSLVLQISALIWLRGALQSLCWILAAVTGAICAFAVAAYILDPRNLWQLVLLMGGPPLFVLTCGVLVMRLVTGPRPSRTEATASAYGYQAIRSTGQFS